MGKFAYTRKEMEDIIRSGRGVMLPDIGVVTNVAFLPTDAEIAAADGDEENMALALDHAQKQAEYWEQQAELLRNPPPDAKLVHTPFGAVPVPASRLKDRGSPPDATGEGDGDPGDEAASENQADAESQGAPGEMTDAQKRAAKAREALAAKRAREEAERKAAELAQEPPPATRTPLP